MSSSLKWPLPVVILAGGYGTRIRHLLPDLPKPMAPVNGRPFVEWVIRYFAAQGCTEFVLSTGYLANRVSSYFAQHPIDGLTVTCVPEVSAQGTAGGFLQAIQALPPRPAWLVVNGDSLVLADPRPLLTLLQMHAASAALLGLAMDDAGRFGTLKIGAAGQLTAFREKAPGAGLINAGVYAFDTGSLARLPTRRPLSLECDVFPTWAADGQVYVSQAKAPFLDIGTPETLHLAERFITLNQHYFL